MTSFGQKGGEGPTRGKRATTYLVTLPDGRPILKRTFSAPAKPAGYAYLHAGVWYIATVGEADAPQFSRYRQCPATPDRPA